MKTYKYSTDLINDFNQKATASRRIVVRGSNDIGRFFACVEWRSMAFRGKYFIIADGEDYETVSEQDMAFEDAVVSGRRGIRGVPACDERGGMARGQYGWEDVPLLDV